MILAHSDLKLAVTRGLAVDSDPTARARGQTRRALCPPTEEYQVRGFMRKIKSFVGCWLLLSSLCLTDCVGQKSMRYPQDAADIIAFVEIFSRLDFAVNDAIKRLGTVHLADRSDFRIIALTPFPSEKDRVRGVTLTVFDNTPEGRSKLDDVQIDYIKPTFISYGELVKKYGAPSYIKPPVAKCPPGAVNCPPRFVGYEFRFVPDTRSLASGKSREVAINLEMEWSKEVPQHTDKDFLAVKAIRFKRIWRD